MPNPEFEADSFQRLLPFKVVRYLFSNKEVVKVNLLTPFEGALICPIGMILWLVLLLLLSPSLEPSDLAFPDPFGWVLLVIGGIGIGYAGLKFAEGRGNRLADLPPEEVARLKNSYKIEWSQIRRIDLRGRSLSIYLDQGKLMAVVRKSDLAVAREFLDTRRVNPS